MRTSRRFINVFLLSLILVFNLCATTVLAAEQQAATQTTYEQAAIRLASSTSHKDPVINKKSVTLVKGQTTSLNIKYSTGKVAWSSSNNKIATVSKNGKVTAKSKGKAIITANTGSIKLKCSIKVETPKISCSSLTLKVKDKKTLFLSGNIQKIKWSTSSKSIATVTSKGVVTAKKAGKATITATVASGKSYQCKVTVKKPEVSATVYITKTGDCYHQNGCRCLRRSKIAISLKDAKRKGYTPCPICCG